MYEYILLIFFILSSKLLNRFSQFLFVVLNILWCSLLFVDTHTYYTLFSPLLTAFLF